jgi:hypothetical protein
MLGRYDINVVKRKIVYNQDNESRSIENIVFNGFFLVNFCNMATKKRMVSPIKGFLGFKKQFAIS